MCGRLACSLGSKELSCASWFKSPKTGHFLKIPWISDEKYVQSYNILPASVAPVIICDRDGIDTSPVLVLSQFGVVPLKHSLNGEKHGRAGETHICRLETINSSKLFKHLLGKGWRCVIPCTGFFEWQSTRGPNRQPYFFYDKHNSSEDLVCTEGTWSQENGWSGLKLLYLAGLFSFHINEQNNKEYSFAIITKKANKDWNWIHHRIPVVLQSEKDVRDWIDSKNITRTKALKILCQPIKNMKAHAVDKTKLNNPTIKTADCVKAYDLDKRSKTKFITDWLKQIPLNVYEKETVEKYCNGENADTQVSEEYILEHYINKHNVTAECTDDEIKIQNKNEHYELKIQPQQVDNSLYQNMRKRTHIAMDDQNCATAFSFDFLQEKQAKIELD